MIDQDKLWCHDLDRSNVHQEKFHFQSWTIKINESIIFLYKIYIKGKVYDVNKVFNTPSWRYDLIVDDVSRKLVVCSKSLWYAPAVISDHDDRIGNKLPKLIPWPYFSTVDSMPVFFHPVPYAIWSTTVSDVHRFDKVNEQSLSFWVLRLETIQNV